MKTSSLFKNVCYFFFPHQKSPFDRSRQGEPDWIGPGRQATSNKSLLNLALTSHYDAEFWLVENRNKKSGLFFLHSLPDNASCLRKRESPPRSFFPLVWSPHLCNLIHEKKRMGSYNTQIILALRCLVWLLCQNSSKV